jgi:hypothetical protein
LYKKENDPKVKERLYSVSYQITRRWTSSFSYCKVMHRSNPWALDWLKRYGEEGIGGLKDRTKCGRSPELSEEVSFTIKKRTIQLQRRLDNKTGRRVNCKEKWDKISHSYISHPS